MAILGRPFPGACLYSTCLLAFPVFRNPQTYQWGLLTATKPFTCALDSRRMQHSQAYSTLRPPPLSCCVTFPWIACAGTCRGVPTTQSRTTGMGTCSGGRRRCGRPWLWGPQVATAHMLRPSKALALPMPGDMPACRHRVSGQSSRIYSCLTPATDCQQEKPNCIQHTLVLDC